LEPVQISWLSLSLGILRSQLDWIYIGRRAASAPATWALAGAGDGRPGLRVTGLVGASSRTIFEEPFWLDAVCPGAWGEVTLGSGDGAPTGRLVFHYKRKFGLTVLRNPPLSPSAGPFVAHADQESNTQRNGRELSVTSELIEQLPHYENARLQLAPGSEGWVALEWNGFRLRPSMSYRIRLDRTAEDLFADMNRDLRYKIRRAARDVVIDDSLDPEAVGEIVVRRLAQKRVRPTIDGAFLARLTDALETNRRLVWTLLARDGQKRVRGGAFFAGDERCVYYLAGGVDPSVPGSVARLLIWEGIRRSASSSGWFDFEGTSVPTVENLFREFGGEQQIRITGTRFSGKLASFERVLTHPILR
jgi:hypothetical protein